MTCYFRHMEHIFKKAGLQIDVDNRKRVDLILHEMAGVNYKDCVGTWKFIKELMKDEIIESLHFAFQKGYDRPEFSDWKWPHK